jgi:hypothetical protein
LPWRQGSQRDAFFLPASVALLPLVALKASKEGACFGCGARNHLQVSPDSLANEQLTVLLELILLQDGAEYLAQGFGQLWRILDKAQCFTYSLADEG